MGEIAASGGVASIWDRVGGIVHILGDLTARIEGFRGFSQTGTLLDKSKMKNRPFRRSITAVIASFFKVGEMLGKVHRGLNPISLK